MLVRVSLKDYVPERAFSSVNDYLTGNHIKLIIAGSRKTKLGTFCISLQTRQPVITINGNLNRYHFLLVLLHEFAHFEVYKQCKRRPQPHGKEWQFAFGRMITKHIGMQHFDDSLTDVLTRFACKPSASFNPRSELGLAISKYDPQPLYQPDDNRTTVEDVPLNAIFTISNGTRFRKGDLKPRSRTFYICVRLDNNRQYLVHKNSPITDLGVSQNCG